MLRNKLRNRMPNTLQKYSTSIYRCANWHHVAEANCLKVRWHPRLYYSNLVESLHPYSMRSRGNYSNVNKMLIQPLCSSFVVACAFSVPFSTRNKGAAPVPRVVGFIRPLRLQTGTLD